MGFTAVDGLPMGTRCGSLDPGVVLYLMQELGMDARAVEDLIYRQSGLFGVSGLSSDMRVLLASDDPHARFAIELYIYRISRELGSLAAAMEGIDALIFRGESASMRRRFARVWWAARRGLARSSTPKRTAEADRSSPQRRAGYQSGSYRPTKN